MRVQFVVHVPVITGLYMHVIEVMMGGVSGFAVIIAVGYQVGVIFQWFAILISTIYLQTSNLFIASTATVWASKKVVYGQRME